MRLGFITSFTFHAIIILFAMVSIPAAWNADDEMIVLPVELLDISEITNVASLQDKPKPEEMPEEPTPPKPEPPKQNKVSDSAPEPIQELTEGEMPPLPEVKKKPEEAKKEPEKKAEKVNYAKAKPRKKPRPPKRKNKDDFDVDQIAALLDKTPEEEQTRQPQKEPKLEDTLEDFLKSLDDAPKQSVGFGTDMTVSEKDAIRQHILQCWRVPAGAAKPEELIVVLRIELEKDGTLKSPPTVIRTGSSSFGSNTFSRASADAASRAVVRCQPYDFLPLDKYESWDDITFTFNPGAMIGR